MENNLTAIEWLVDQIFGEHTEQWIKEIEQAKQMMQQQIESAYRKGYNHNSLGRFSDPEAYYNETFKSE